METGLERRKSNGSSIYHSVVIVQRDLLSNHEEQLTKGDAIDDILKEWNPASQSE